MSRTRWLEILVVVSLGAALLAATSLLSGPSRREALGPSSESRPPESPPVERAAPEAPSEAPPPAAPPTLAAAREPEGQLPNPDGGLRLQPPGSVAEFEDDDDRKQSLLELRRQRFQGGMEGLNQRGQRRARQAESSTAGR